jgi:hypothetical protein
MKDMRLYQEIVRGMAEAGREAHPGVTILDSYEVVIEALIGMRQDPAKYLKDPEDLEPLIYAAETLRDLERGA